MELVAIVDPYDIGFVYLLCFACILGVCSLCPKVNDIFSAKSFELAAFQYSIFIAHLAVCSNPAVL